MNCPPDGAWRPDRASALAALEDFIPRAGPRYARRRNYDRGAGQHDGVSGLSPWIRHRVLLESEVVAAVLGHHSLDAARKFVEEVFWRTYWKGWLEHRPSVWSDYRQGVVEHLRELADDPRLSDLFTAATRGETGIECFDAWVRELVTTGYLHNHARMWFASIWIFTLRLPWELGADLFLRHLLDGDPASNTLSWRWVGGMQTRGKTYLARPENIAQYTENRFGAITGISNTALPLPSPDHPPPHLPDRPAAPEPRLRTGLLITEDDLHTEFVTDELAGIEFVAALQTTAGRSVSPVADRVNDFVRGAIDDALDRCGIEDKSFITDDTGISGTGGLEAWALERGLRQVVTPYAPVGPAASTIETLSARLSAQGIRVVRIRRRWDEACWPLAKCGFFRFRKHIPQLIRQLVGSNEVEEGDR